MEIDGKVIVESGAILTYLVEREGKLGPADGAKEDYTYWMHYAEGSAMLPLLVKLITSGVRGAPVPFFIKPIAKAIANKIDGNFTDGELTAHFGWIEKALEGSRTSRGMFSAADIQMSYPIEASLPGPRCFRTVPIPRPGSTALKHVQRSRRRARRVVNPS